MTTSAKTKASILVKVMQDNGWFSTEGAPTVTQCEILEDCIRQGFRQHEQDLRKAIVSELSNAIPKHSTYTGGSGYEQPLYCFETTDVIKVVNCTEVSDE